MNKKETGHEKMKKKKESFLNIVLYCEQLLHLCNLWLRFDFFQAILKK